MKPIVRAAWILAAGVMLAVAGVAAYVARTWDRTYEAPLPEVALSSKPAVLARGEYLVFGPAHECHGGSIDALKKRGDGERIALSGGFRLPLGPLGAAYARNLTPDRQTGIGPWAGWSSASSASRSPAHRSGDDD